MASLDHFLISLKLLTVGHPDGTVPCCYNSPIVKTLAQGRRPSHPNLIEIKLRPSAVPPLLVFIMLVKNFYIVPYIKKKRPRYHNVVAPNSLKPKINIWLNKSLSHKIKAKLLSQRISQTIRTNQIPYQQILH